MHHEKVEQFEWMQFGEQMPKITHDSYSKLIDTSFDWKSVKLDFSLNQINSMKNWVNEQKILYNENIDTVLLTDVNPDQLNRYQRFAYNIIDKFINDNKQLFMILLGTAGTGKSYTVSAISKNLQNQLRRTSPTAKAAFLIKGSILIK